jgi:hypothetical protein
MAVLVSWKTSYRRLDWLLQNIFLRLGTISTTQQIFSFSLISATVGQLSGTQRPSALQSRSVICTYSDELAANEASPVANQNALI